MNIMNPDCVHDLGRVGQDNIYPEWVAMERFYNCENFYRAFENHKSLIVRWFGRKRLAR